MLIILLLKSTSEINGLIQEVEFPNFENEYEEDLKFWQAKTTTQKAINEWINKNP